MISSNCNYNIYILKEHRYSVNNKDFEKLQHVSENLEAHTYVQEVETPEKVLFFNSCWPWVSGQEEINGNRVFNCLPVNWRHAPNIHGTIQERLGELLLQDIKEMHV